MIRRAFLSLIPTIPFVASLMSPKITQAAETEAEEVARLNKLVSVTQKKLHEIATRKKPGEIARLQSIMDHAYGDLIPGSHRDALPPSGRSKEDIQREFDSLNWNQAGATMDQKAAKIGLACKLLAEYFIVENTYGTYCSMVRKERPVINSIENGKMVCLIPNNYHSDLPLIRCGWSVYSPLKDYVVSGMGYVWLTY